MSDKNFKNHIEYSFVFLNEDKHEQGSFLLNLKHYFVFHALEGQRVDSGAR